MNQEILTVNAGSSSIRLAGYRATGGAPAPVGRCRLEGSASRPLAPLLEQVGLTGPAVVVHRVVHGGHTLTTSVEIDAHVEAEIARLSALAPLHNPIAAEWIATCRRALPSATQVAVFDTAFFATLPEATSRYALPRDVCHRLGIRRYGFHGIAHRSMWDTWQEVTHRGRTGKLVSFQLGSGCSAAAIEDGRPIDTSMGMTPLEGLVMSTRAGDLDPGILVHLATEGGMLPRELSALLAQQAGLRGLSGLSGDVHELLASTSSEAALALEVYCHRARKYLGAYLATLGGADAIAFGGGVGEHEPAIRARIAAGASFCGLRLDEAANLHATGDAATLISAPDSTIEAWVLPVDEEALLADEAWALTKGRS